MALYPSLVGKSVLISGGGGGIGRAVVEAFSAQGAKVAFLDVDHRGAEAVASATSGSVFRVCDLRDIEQARLCVKALADEVGPFSFLINNAGNDQAQAFSDVAVADWDDRVAVNLRHQFFLAQMLAPGMKALGGGAIVNLGSISWRIGARGVSVYATLKSAITGLTKAMARELGPDNIRVNEIAPGWVLTERQLAKGALAPEKFGQYLDRQCLKTHLAPVDIAEMALWLCASESRLCSGQTFTIDAGAS